MRERQWSARRIREGGSKGNRRDQFEKVTRERSFFCILKVSSLKKLSRGEGPSVRQQSTHTTRSKGKIVERRGRRGQFAKSGNRTKKMTRSDPRRGSSPIGVKKNASHGIREAKGA